MRWTNKIKSKKPSRIIVGKKPPEIGDVKEIIKFAFLPTKIGNDNVVWLEQYIKVYVYTKIYKDHYPSEWGGGYTSEYNKWVFKERKFYDRKNIM